MPHSRTVLLLEATSLAIGVGQGALLTSDGEVIEGEFKLLKHEILTRQKLVLCHAPAMIGRLRFSRSDLGKLHIFDLLELFAFVYPARFVVPTLKGIAGFCGLSAKGDMTSQVMLVPEIVEILLEDLCDQDLTPQLHRLAWNMARHGWSWGPAVLAAFGEGAPDFKEAQVNLSVRAAITGLDIWQYLPEWEEQPPSPPPGDLPVNPIEARQRLAQILGDGAESRPSQSDYTSAVSAAFAGVSANAPSAIVLAEAGTGVGKTLGYLSPASLWAGKNNAPVWVSTYTKNLQHQIDDELARLFPDPALKAQKVVLRKGRENYLCLYNFEEAARLTPNNPASAIHLGIMARWALACRDGDLNGNDFPSWLQEILGHRLTLGLADRRGECIYTACQHYSRCFIEHSQRKARKADLVIANHALVMFLAVHGYLLSGRIDDADVTGPAGTVSRVVFDEGHHVFNAADSAFSLHLTAVEMVELRRWLRGAEGRGRIRGLKSRAGDLLSEEEGQAHLEELLQRASVLCRDGWSQRLEEGQPLGKAEVFLHHVALLVLVRNKLNHSGYSIETTVENPGADLLLAAKNLLGDLEAMLAPAINLRKTLLERLDREVDTLETATRVRIEVVAQSLLHRCKYVLEGWIDMLRHLDERVLKDFVDWFEITRNQGRNVDVGYFRHYRDPTIPFAKMVLERIDGALITSATLTDGSGDAYSDWLSAEARTGAIHLPAPATRAQVPSPFDYPTQTRVFLVNDIGRNDLDQLASAYRELFFAAQGGALGLFTAISRLRNVYHKIARPLENSDLSLYAQHVDKLSLASLIDIFRAEEDSCLLGTDAVRDGVDVPGNSLRLIVFDRVPWPRPSILHKERKKEFGGKTYDEAMTRLKLKQAFGRLIRRVDDKGVFVLLDKGMPSRLEGAFPEGVVQRVGIAEAIQKTRAFLGTGPPTDIFR